MFDSCFQGAADIVISAVGVTLLLCAGIVVQFLSAVAGSVSTFIW